jgi:hypothetical protein
MSSNPNGGSLLLFLLPEDQHCKGHENFASWEIYMLAHGGPCGLINYWENKINVHPDPTTPSSMAAPPSGTLSPSMVPSPLHSLSPSSLEYMLRESVAMSSILINLVDIPGTGVNPRGKLHEAWALLKEQYGKPSKRTQNMRERDLDECRYIDGTKVAGEGGHIKRMRNLQKLANDAGSNYNDSRFQMKLIDSFPESWDAICSICYNMQSLFHRLPLMANRCFK